MNPIPLSHWDIKRDMNAHAGPHLERLVKIWGLDIEEICTGGWTPEPVALKMSAQWTQSPFGDLSFRCEVPGVRSLQKSEFHVGSGKYALEWHPVQTITLLAYGDKEGAQKWAEGIRSFFRRNCWLSGCLIPVESHHETMEWLAYGREVKLSTEYLKRISR